MEFCPNCGRVLRPVKKSETVVLTCSRCGYEKPSDQSVVVTTRIQRDKKDDLPFIEGDGPEVLPKSSDVICPNCGNREAYFWQVQTRSADEPMTSFFRCTKCNSTWREYG